MDYTGLGTRKELIEVNAFITLEETAWVNKKGKRRKKNMVLGLKQVR